MRVNLCLIGCGAAAHAYYVDALRACAPVLDTVFFVDVNRARAEALAVDFPGAAVAEDYQQIADDVQAAIIALPHFLHYRSAMHLLTRGVHVLCEKPLAETAQECEHLIAAAAAHQTTLSVNNTRRLIPVNRLVVEAVRRGDIGDPVSLRYVEGSAFGWPTQTGFYFDPKLSSKGVLLDVGAHAVDTVCWWLQGPLDLLCYEDDSLGGPESLAVIKAWRGKCRISIWLNRLVDLANSYEIVGTKATIRGKLDEARSYEREQGDRKWTVKSDEQVLSYPEYVGQLVDNVIKSALGMESPRVPAAEVMHSIQFIEQCYASRKRLDMPWMNRLEDFYVCE